jgi:hypothetical protein
VPPDLLVVPANASSVVFHSCPLNVASYLIGSDGFAEDIIFKIAFAREV